jgi:CheY-like chemotaxis protein
LGLDLAIVRHLVELHEGNVYATSAGIGKGATFTVQLPTLERSIAVDSNLVTESQGFSNLADLKVLVVDDDLDNRELIAFILAQQQIQVTIAASAAESFEIVSNLEIDILISDIGMPDEDGYSLLRHIRTHPNPSKCSIPAIALTAFAKEENRMEAIAAGFQRHLSKPINPDDLIEVVSSLARQRL